MTTSRLNRFWTLIIVLLVAITVIGGIVVWSRCSPSQPVEITITPHQELRGQIYIGGAVTNPGFYPLIAGDTIEALLQATGGGTNNADFNEMRLYLPEVGEGQEPQKININRAEVWLLEALDGIGPAKAQAIVDYRDQNGSFQNTREITNVEGIGPTIYERIKHLISAAD